MDYADEVYEELDQGGHLNLGIGVLHGERARIDFTLIER